MLTNFRLHNFNYILDKMISQTSQKFTYTVNR